jgi:hypothetical protein
MPPPKKPTYPTVTIPPATTGQGGIGGQLVSMLKEHGPAWVQYAPLILKWAGVYNVDPLYIASVLLTENAKADATAVSSAGAVGPAQIADKSVNPSLNPNAIWDGPAVLTDQWKQNFNNAVKYVSWRVAGEINQYGSLDAAYGQGYNPGYTGKPPSKFLPSGYVPTTGAGTQATAAETAGTTAAGTAALKGLKSTQWAVLRNGKVKFVTTRDKYDPSTGAALPSAPKDSLKIFGQPLSASAFLQQYAQISDDYLAYTNGRPTFAQAAQVIKKGTSQFQLRQQLAQTPGFVDSPVWKQTAPSYIGAWHKVYGPDSKPDQAAIRYGVANNLGDGFTDYLRQRPDYQTSQEFKQQTATFSSIYGQIYGNPASDPKATERINAAALGGWSPDEFANYLRQQPEWKGSAEAQTLYFGLAQRMGLIQGDQTVIGTPHPTPAPTSP